MTQNGIVPTSSDKTIQRIFHKFVVCNIKSMTKTKRKEKKKKERKKNKKIASNHWTPRYGTEGKL